jgi:hypothetical protein
MKTKTLKLAMDKAAKLPRSAQEEIARDVLERLSTMDQLRAALKIGIRQLDAGLGRRLDIRAVLVRARREYETGK